MIFCNKISKNLSQTRSDRIVACFLAIMFGYFLMRCVNKFLWATRQTRSRRMILFCVAKFCSYLYKKCFAVLWDRMKYFLWCAKSIWFKAYSISVFLRVLNCDAFRQNCRLLLAIMFRCFLLSRAIKCNYNYTPDAFRQNYNCICCQNLYWFVLCSIIFKIKVRRVHTECL